MTKKSMKAIEGIYPTLCPTFPRSGFIVKMRVLQAYFGNQFHGVDPYKYPDRSFKKAPKWCNFQKDHDFDLDTEKEKDKLNLVSIRNPVHAIAGWRKMEIAGGMKKKDWRPWMREKMCYWSDFANKWLYSPVPNRLVVPYEKLVGDPFTSFLKIICFISESGICEDPDRLDQILKDLKIEPQPPKNLPFETV